MSPLEELKEKIKSFADLEKGWDLDNGDKLSKRTIEHVLFLLDILSEEIPLFDEKLKFFVTPNSNGGVTISFSIDDMFIDLIANPDLSLEISEEKGYGTEYEIVSHSTPVTINGVISRLNEFIGDKRYFIVWVHSSSLFGESRPEIMGLTTDENFAKSLESFYCHYEEVKMIKQ